MRLSLFSPLLSKYLLWMLLISSQAHTSVALRECDRLQGGQQELNYIIGAWASDLHCSNICDLGEQIERWIARYAPHLIASTQDLTQFCHRHSDWKRAIINQGGWKSARVNWRADQGSVNDQLRRDLVGKIEALVLQILSWATRRSCVGIFEQVGTDGYFSDIDIAFIPHPKLGFEYRMAAKLLFDSLFCHYFNCTPAHLIDTECYLQQVGESLRTEQHLYTCWGRALFAQEQIQAALIKFRQSLGKNSQHWHRICSIIAKKIERKSAKKAAIIAKMFERIECLYTAMHVAFSTKAHSVPRHSDHDLFSFNDCAMQCIYSQFLNPLQVKIQRSSKNLKRAKTLCSRQEFEHLIDRQRIEQALFGTLAESCTAEGYITQGAFRDVVTNRGGQHEHNTISRELQLALDPLQLPRKKSEMALFPKYELSSPLDRFISSMENFFIFEAHLATSQYQLHKVQRSWIEESKYACRALKNGITTFDLILQRGRWEMAEKNRLRGVLALAQEKFSYVQELQQIKRGLQISRRAYEEAVFPLLAKALAPAQIICNLAKIPLQVGPWVAESESTFILYEKILHQTSCQSQFTIASVDVKIPSKSIDLREIRALPLLFDKKGISSLTFSELSELNLLAMAYAGVPWKFFALAQFHSNLCSDEPQPIELNSLQSLSARKRQILFEQIAQITLKQCELGDLKQLQEATQQIREFQLELLVEWIEQQDLFADKSPHFDLDPHRAWLNMIAKEPSALN